MRGIGIVLIPLNRQGSSESVQRAQQRAEGEVERIVAALGASIAQEHRAKESVRADEEAAGGLHAVDVHRVPGLPETAPFHAAADIQRNGQQRIGVRDAAVVHHPRQRGLWREDRLFRIPGQVAQPAQEAIGRQDVIATMRRRRPHATQPAVAAVRPRTIPLQARDRGRIGGAERVEVVLAGQRQALAAAGEGRAVD